MYNRMTAILKAASSPADVLAPAGPAGRNADLAMNRDVPRGYIVCNVAAWRARETVDEITARAYQPVD